MSSDENRSSPDAIAVIGLACRFPGASSPDEFWQNLRDGVESITVFSEEELDAAGIDAKQYQEQGYVRAKGIVEYADCFDAGFFGFSPREASLMDPQQRVFLETAWAALEHAGYDGRDYPGAIGVFGGGILSLYLLRNLWPNAGLISAAGNFQTAVGNDPTFMASRVAYHLDLRGPSVSVGTACSTSLVAVHLACQSLLAYESDMALAGGVSLHLPLINGYRYEEGGILSPDGHCRPFDANAAGTVSSDGAGVVVLKRLQDAIADGDFIHALIRGSAVNNDGNMKVGYTAPTVAGQARVIAEALAVAGVEPETISMIETHGAGTLLGDPIEFAALAEAFEGFGSNPRSCALGSVKSNIGHLDAAAGIAGLIKTVLALRHRKIPPTLHFKQANAQIDLSGTPFYINAEVIDVESHQSPMRAGVSSFGIGGTNAHVILEEPPEPANESVEQQPRPFDLLFLSARTPDALEAVTERTAEYIERAVEIDFQDIAYTLRRGRRAFEHRRVIVCGGREEAVRALRDRDSQRLSTSLSPLDRPLVTFMFPGLGDHYDAMGWEVYCTEFEFRDMIDRCAELLRGHLDVDIRDFLYAGRDWSRPVLSGGVSAPAIGESNLDLRAIFAGARSGVKRSPAPEQPAVAQPAIFITEIALATLLLSWGIEPEAMIGHSIGEFAAAYLSGVLSLEDAVELVATRARLIQSKAKPGAMLAVPLGEEELRAMLPEGVSLGAINGVKLCVASGEEAGIAELETRLGKSGVSCHRLRSTHAYHSKMMEPLVEPLMAVLEKFELRPPQIPYISCITGTWIKDEEATDPAYWAQHLCHTVRFQKGLSQLLTDPRRAMLEVGPGQGLTSHAARERTRMQRLETPLIPTMRWSYDRHSELAVLLRGVGQLWLAGVPLDTSSLLFRPGQRRVPLPTYPFERQRYWIDPPAGEPSAPAIAAPVKKADVAEWFYLPFWKPSARPPVQRQGAESRCRILFVDAFGVGEDLAQRLRARGETVVTVEPGRSFRREGEKFVIDPSRGEDYEELVRELCESGRAPDAVIHFWSFTRDEDAPPSSARFSSFQQVGYYSVARILQALWRRGQGRSLRLDIVANHLYEVNGSEKLIPEKATLSAPAMVAPQELPGVICRCVDTDIPPDDIGQRNAIITQLIDEVISETTEPAVAYRQGRRWVLGYEHVRLEDADQSRLPLRRHGVYLITGGLGGVGLVLARHLAETSQARLVLIGRSAFPKREAWGDWIETHDDDDRTSLKILQLQAIEALGSEVLILQADVSSLEAVNRVVSEAELRFGELHGVIHAAGAVGAEIFCEISQTTTTNSETQFSAKAHGLMALAEALADMPLDFCILTSSLSAVLGGLGFCAYSAANLFMDAFVRWKNRAGGVRWTSVDWDSWRLTGIRPVIAGLGATVSEYVMEPEEAGAAFDRILAEGNLTQVVVSSGDLHARLRQWIGKEQPSDGSPDSRAAYDRPNLKTPYAPPRGELEPRLVEIWEELFGITPIGINDNFFELGGHSLMATQLSARLYSNLQVELSLATLLQAPTIAELAVAVVSAQADKTNPAAVESLLAEIGQLSDSEVEQLLAGQYIPQVAVDDE